MSWRCRVQWKLTGIRKEGSNFQLTYDTPEGMRTIKARSVALTVPAFVAADLLQVCCCQLMRSPAHSKLCFCDRPW